MGSCSRLAPEAERHVQVEPARTGDRGDLAHCGHVLGQALQLTIVALEEHFRNVYRETWGHGLGGHTALRQRASENADATVLPDVPLDS